MKDSVANPYQSPRTDAAADPADAEVLREGERIAFSGRVREETLRKALAGRFSWAALGTLVVGAVICFAAMPPTFLNPFVRVGKLRIDPVSEIMGVAGIGLVGLAIRHVLEHSTRWGVRRRERYFLRRIRDLYETHVAGWLGQDGIYVREDRCESWLCWPALNHFQANDEVAFLEWGSGAGGMTVLTREMFDDDSEFGRACTMFGKRVTSPFDCRELSQLEDYFIPADAAWPADEQTIAECSQRISFRDVVGSTLLGLPLAILRDSRPLHYFFGMLVATALIFAEHQPGVTLTMAAIWLGIQLLAVVFSVISLRHYVYRGRERLLASKTRFTRDELYVATTVGYFRAPLSEFRVVRCDLSQIVLAQKGHDEIQSKLLPANFPDEQQWRALHAMMSDAESTIP